MLKHMTFSVITVAVAALACMQARANDSSAELSTGGLVLTKQEAIALEDEDLYISPKQVRVRYRFRNSSAAAIRTIVAFPLPDVAANGPDDVIAIPRDKSTDNFLGFSTTVDGRQVDARLEQKVFAKGIEQTSVLREYGLPFAPYLEGLNERLDALPLDARKKLVDLGLAVSVTEYQGDKPVQRLYPSWTLKTTYYWDQIFPVGDTKIEHQYQPSVGSTLGTLVGADFVDALLMKRNPDESDRDTIESFRKSLKTYCVDDDLLRSARAIQKNAKKVGPLTEQRISYILKTATNWSGPIGTFRLIVDKQYPDNLVSFCASGVRKTGATTFEVKMKDFVPTEDLSILILTTHLEN
jgi:hypothetical protein